MTSIFKKSNNRTGEDGSRSFDAATALSGIEISISPSVTSFYINVSVPTPIDM